MPPSIPIAWSAAHAPGKSRYAQATAHLLPALRASKGAILFPSLAAASGMYRSSACALKLPAPACVPTAVRDKACRSSRRDVPALRLFVDWRIDNSVANSSRTSRRHRACAFKRLPQLMPRAKQHHTHKGAAHSERVGNFVVTHIRVVAQHQRHARSRSQFVQRLADLFAGSFFDQLIELIWIRMLER